MTAWLVRWLSGARAPERLALLALALSLPSIALPLAVDDHGFRTRILIEGRGPDEVFRWNDASGEDGRLSGRTPWWSLPASEVHFLRPLSGLTHWIDFHLWPAAVWWMRLQTCLLYALLVWVAARCYRALASGIDAHAGNVSSQRTPATGRPELPTGDGLQAAGLTWGLAALMFAVNEANAQSLAFIAGRNTILSALFGLAALWAHVRRLHRSTALARLAGPLWFAVALTCGEAAVAALGYLVAHALVLDHRRPVARFAALGPYLTLTLLWAGLYVAGGYGA